MRMVVHTLAFNRWSEVERATKLLKQTNPDGVYEHYIVDVGYPLPSKRETTRELLRICEENGSTLLKPFKNRSVSRNWWWVYKELELSSGDVLIGMDPDGNPITSGWVCAMADVLRSGVGLVCLNRVNTSRADRVELEDYSAAGARNSTSGGRNVLEFNSLVAWSLMGMSADFLEKSGRLSEWNPIYGYTEHWIATRLQEVGMRWVMLSDFYDDHLDAVDPEYTEWKLESISRTTVKQFDEWLAARQAPPSPTSPGT